MNIVLECGWCGEENILFAEPKGFWREWYWMPDDWECFNCGGLTITADPPWTPAA